MSSHGYATPLSIDIHPSLILGTCYGAVGMVASGAVLLADLPWWLQLLLVLCCCAYAGYLIYTIALLRTPDAIVQLTWQQENRWWLRQRNGEACHAHLLTGSYRHPLLCVLRLQDEHGRRRSAVLTADRVESEPFRRLRVRLGLWDGTAAG